MRKKHIIVPANQKTPATGDKTVTGDNIYSFYLIIFIVSVIIVVADIAIITKKEAKKDFKILGILVCFSLLHIKN